MIFWCVLVYLVFCTCTVGKYFFSKLKVTSGRLISVKIVVISILKSVLLEILKIFYRVLSVCGLLILRRITSPLTKNFRDFLQCLIIRVFSWESEVWFFAKLIPLMFLQRWNGKILLCWTVWTCNSACRWCCWTNEWLRWYLSIDCIFVDVL